MMKALWPHIKLDDSCENPGCRYSERAFFFSTVTQLSTDPTHMLDLQKDDPQHPHTSPSPLPFLRPTPLRWDEEIQLRSHTTEQLFLDMIALFTQNCINISVCLWQLDRHICTSVKQEQLCWVKLCLYWHNVMFQLSLIKQHGYKLHSHKGTRFVHFALWFIDYCMFFDLMLIGEVSRLCFIITQF